MIKELHRSIQRLSRNGSFSLPVIITIAATLGLSAALSVLYYSVVLAPLNGIRAKPLVALYVTSTKAAHGFRQFTINEYKDIANQKELFEDVVAGQLFEAGMKMGSYCKRGQVFICSASLFRASGVPPLYGRFFTDEDEADGHAGELAVLSYECWRRMGSPVDIVGKSLNIYGHSYVVTGVMPRQFRGLTALFIPDVWIQLSSFANFVVSPDGKRLKNVTLDPGSKLLFLRATLADGMGLPEARLRAKGLDSSIFAAKGKSGEESHLMIYPADRFSAGSVPYDGISLRTISLMFLCAVFGLLSVCIINLGNFITIESFRRLAEIAIRRALGATTFDILKAFLFDAILLTVMGGAFGFLLATLTYYAVIELIAHFSSALNLVTEIGYASEKNIALVCLIGSGSLLLVSASLPGTQLSGESIYHVLRHRSTSGVFVSNGTWGFLKRNLLGIQIAVGLPLLYSTAFLGYASREAHNLKLGFSTDQKYLVDIDTTQLDGGFSEVTKAKRIVEEQLVTSVVAIATSAPFSSRAGYLRFFPRPAPGFIEKKDGYSAMVNYITPGYFKTLDIGMLGGSEFSNSGGQNGIHNDAVVIVDRQLALQLYNGQTALGRFIAINDVSGTYNAEIIGVSDAFREDGLSAGFPRRIFLPFSRARGDRAYIYVSLKGSQIPAAVALKKIREILDETTIGSAVLNVSTLGNFVANEPGYGMFKIGLVVFAAISLVAVLLTSIGIYGVSAASALTRRKEFGVRMALGGTTVNILRLALREFWLRLLPFVGVGAIASYFVVSLFAKYAGQTSSMHPVLFGESLLITCSMAAVSLVVPIWWMCKGERIYPMVNGTI